MSALTDEWLTTGDVARATGLSCDTVRKLINAERLGAERLGHHYRVARSSLEELRRESKLANAAND